MSRPALLNLVRKSVVSTSETHDYTTAGELATRRDEIKLVDADDDPCAVPMLPNEDDLDYQYNYVTGAIGHQLRGTRLSLDLAIDYITDATWTVLKRWKQERALVWLTPNLGRNTMFSWRAVSIKGTFFDGGPAAKDLTTNYALISVCGQYLRYWDTERRLMLPKTTSNKAQLVLTPGGAGFQSFPSVVNRMKPTSPQSGALTSASTASGWVAGGIHAGDITASLVTNGFGLADAPHSLRVGVAARVTTDRYLIIADQFNSTHANYALYTMINDTPIIFTVWMRGCLTNAATLTIGVSGTAEVVTRSLAGIRFDGWTPISVTLNPSAITGGNLPYCAIGLNDTTGVACWFEIGPTMIVQQSGYGSCAAAPVWTPQVSGGTVSGGTHIVTGSDLRLPGQGTLFCSYYAPADIADSWRTHSSRMTLCGNSDLTLYLTRSLTTEALTIYSLATGNTQYSTSTAGGIIRAGQLNTVAVTWDAYGVKLYANGELVATDTGTLPAIGGSNSEWKIGSGQSNYGCAPLAMLTCRIDEGAMTATEVAQIHTALTDAVATAMSRAASGRTFRIRRIPQTLRSAHSGSQILGPLGLEQVDYDPFTADPFTREVSLG